MAGRFSIEAIFKAVDRFSAPVAKMQSRVAAFAKNAGKSVSEMNSVVDKVAGGFAKVATAVGAVSLVAGAGLFAAAKRGADFEQAMAAVGAVSLMTKAQVADLAQKAKELGSTTKYSATEVAQGMELMGKAGFDNKQILASIGGVLNAAAAEGADFGEVASHVSNILKGMGLETTREQTERVADVLTLASARTNSSITSLGESMKNVAPVARQFGVSFEDAVSSVALLQDVGMDASEAGTATATMLTKLAKPSRDAANEMAALGIKFQDAKGNMLPLIDIFAQFEKASQKSGGNMKQAAFFAELVGLRGQKAAINLKDLFASGKFTKLRDELGGAAGKAKEMADLRMQNLTDQLKLLGNAVDVVAIDIFNLGGDSLTKLVQKMRDWVGANKEAIVSGVEKFLDDVATNAGKIVTWMERIGKFAAVWATWAAGVKIAAAAQWLFNAAMAANPITLWTLAIVGAVSLLVAFWPEISAFFGRVWDGLKDITSRVASTVGGFLSGLWGPVKSFFLAAIEFIVGLIVVMLAPALGLLRPLFDLIVQAAHWVMEHWEPIKGFFAEIWGAVRDYFVEVWDSIKLVFLDFVAFVAPTLSAAVEAIKGIWSPIAGFFSNLWKTIAGSFKSVFSWVLEKLEWAAKTVREIGHFSLFGGGAPGSPAESPAPSPAPAPQVASPVAEILGKYSGDEPRKDSVDINVWANKGTGAAVRKNTGAPLKLTPSTI